MKWLLDRIGRLFAAYSQKPASGYEPIISADPHQTDLVPRSEPRRSSERLGSMLAAFGKHGVKSIEDLADCATDDLDGWSESKDGKTIKHKGILDRFKVSRKDCEAIIINARIKAGWIK